MPYIHRCNKNRFSYFLCFHKFVKFVDLLSKTQKKLDEASTTIEDATKKSKKIQKKLDTVTVIDGTQMLEIEQSSLFYTAEDEED